MYMVILCSRNGEAYIERQIASILGQSIGDLRLHVFDDASSDGTPRILKGLEEAYPDRIRVTLRQEPTGSACRNFLLGLRETEDADYYLFSDQDDVWDVHKTEALAGAFEGDGPQLVFSDARVTDGELKLIAPSFTAYQKLDPRRTALNHLLIMNQVTGAACMFNRALRDLAVSVPLPQHAVMHDHFLALTAAAFGSIGYLDFPLYSYCQHEDNVLGAQKGSMLGETARRLGLGGVSREEMDERSRSSYAAVFDQAEEFLALYRDRLPAEKAQLIETFVSMRRMGRLGKIRTLLKHDFTFNTIYRTVGECLFL